MKLTLIRPSELVPPSGNGVTTPPVGTAYLAGHMRSQGHEVRFIDGVGEKIEQYTLLENETHGMRLHGLTVTEIAERIEPSFAGVIGISCMFSQDWPVVRELIRLVRQRFPESVIICGGEHMTAATEYSLRDCRAIDVGVLGEGEATLAELTAALENSKNINAERLARIAGVAFLDADGEYHESSAREPIEDVDTIARPAWDLIPIEAYLASGSGFGISRGRNMPIVASRGCPYGCTFCSNEAMWGRRWRARDPIQVVDEIEEYHHRYDANNFDFYDLTMIVRKDWIMTFCEELERRGLQISYQLPSGTRCEAIDEEVAAALKRTGCCHIVYAPESGSERTLERVNKRITLKRVLASMKAAVRAGTFVKANIVVGFPSETHGDMWRTLLFLIRMAWIGVQDVFVYTFTPYPGTALFRELSESGRISRLDDEFFLSLSSYINLTDAVSYAEKLSSRGLAAYRLGGLMLFYSLSFLFHPWRVVRVVTNMLNHRADTRIEQFIRTLLGAARPGRNAASPAKGPERVPVSASA
jgi:radical SAM superfamily enzyme YgiQ (UPF0313 family)